MHFSEKTPFPKDPFFRTRLDVASNSLLHSGTQRKRNDFSSDVSSSAVLMRHQMQNFLENYGCGCVWAVLDITVSETASCP